MLNTEVLKECIKSWPERPTIDPAETLYTPDQLEAQIDAAMRQLAWMFDAGAAMIQEGIDAFRGIAEAAESMLPRPTKNQQLPAFRRPSWQRRA